MNKKEIFYKVAEHLMKQNQRASNEDGGCRYLTHSGLKCAVGCLIPKKYDPLHLDGTVDNEEVAPILEELGYGDHTEFLRELQRLHDNAPVEEWKEKLATIASKNHWKIPDCVRA